MRIRSLRRSPRYSAAHLPTCLPGTGRHAGRARLWLCWNGVRQGAASIAAFAGRAARWCSAGELPDAQTRALMTAAVQVEVVEPLSRHRFCFDGLGRKSEHLKGFTCGFRERAPEYISLKRALPACVRMAICCCVQLVSDR